MNIAQKLRAIRKAEGLTQAKFCEISGIALGTVKNYEGGHQEPGLHVVLQVTNARQFAKYTLWLMNNQTAPESGQIAPGCAHSGQGSKESDHSERNAG
ncbi:MULTISPECIES: helix-turn-helix domain-containing protein [Serratia]|uniref:helix-turn-helix domain-containing protein n=1 Tax=Serratia TaxID=613 RepID=UPI0009305E0D|nr:MULTISPECIES: helix-turn-helix transcriptional regulator [Serratia]MBJ2066975.1 helix-turn-helix transcriptional regulator [Serratia odorifera]